jgi:branched-chain amino acid transport system substrate-binding protein
MNMDKLIRRNTWGRLAALLVGAAVVGWPALAHTQEKPPIRIGVVLELTGRQAIYGESSKRGIEMAADAFGDTTIGGRKVAFIFRDVQSDPQFVISALNELVNSDQINYLMGPCASPLVSAAIPTWRQAKPLWVQFCGSSSRLSEEVGGEDHFFHTYPYANHYHQAEGAALQHYLGRGKKAAVIYSDDEYGRGHIQSLTKAYQAAGIELVGTEVARVGTTDFNPILTKLGRSNPDILVALVQGADLTALSKQIYARKFRAPYRVSGGDVQFDSFSNAVGNEAQDGWIGPSTYVAGVEQVGDPDYPKLLPSSREWEARFRKRYNRAPDQIDIGSYVSAVMLLIALQRAGGDNEEKVAAELAKLDVATPLGRGRFQAMDGTKHQAFTDMMVFQRQQGHPVVVYPGNIAMKPLVPVLAAQP